MPARGKLPSYPDLAGKVAVVTAWARQRSIAVEGSMARGDGPVLVIGSTGQQPQDDVVSVGLDMHSNIPYGSNHAECTVRFELLR
jgi:hypothetical protein